MADFAYVEMVSDPFIIFPRLLIPQLNSLLQGKFFDFLGKFARIETPVIF